MTVLPLRQQLPSLAVFTEARRRCILGSDAIFQTLLHWARTLWWRAWGKEEQTYAIR
jgi:hypothetical protein